MKQPKRNPGATKAKATGGPKKPKRISAKEAMKRGAQARVRYSNVKRKAGIAPSPTGTKKKATASKPKSTKPKRISAAEAMKRGAQARVRYSNVKRKAGIAPSPGGAKKQSTTSKPTTSKPTTSKPKRISAVEAMKRGAQARVRYSNSKPKKK